MRGTYSAIVKIEKLFRVIGLLIGLFLGYQAWNENYFACLSLLWHGTNNNIETVLNATFWPCIKGLLASVLMIVCSGKLLNQIERGIPFFVQGLIWLISGTLPIRVAGIISVLVGCKFLYSNRKELSFKLLKTLFLGPGFIVLMANLMILSKNFLLVQICLWAEIATFRFLIFALISAFLGFKFFQWSIKEADEERSKLKTTLEAFFRGIVFSILLSAPATLSYFIVYPSLNSFIGWLAYK